VPRGLAARTIQQATCVQRDTVKNLKSTKTIHIKNVYIHSYIYKICICIFFFFFFFFFEKNKKELQKLVRKVLGNDWVHLRGKKKQTRETSEKVAQVKQDPEPSHIYEF